MGKSNSVSSSSDSEVEISEDEAETVKVFSRKRPAAAIDSSSEEEEGAVDVSNMTELEREQYQLEKYERQEKKKRERELKQQMEEEEHASKKTRRSAGGSGRATSRREEEKASKRKEALENLKRQREEGTGLNRLDEDDVYSDEDDYDDHDAGSSSRSRLMSKERYEVRQKRRDLSRRSDNILEDEDEEGMDAEVEELDESSEVNFDQAVHYLYRTRKFFDECFFEPYFESAVAGNFVKVALGKNDRHQRVYRMVEVLHTCKSSKAYDYLGEMTTTCIQVRCGTSRKSFQLTQISSKPLRREEFDYWIKNERSGEKKTITHLAAKKIRDKINDKIANYKRLPGDVDRMIARKEAAGRVTISLGRKIAQQQRSLAVAESKGDIEEALQEREKLMKLKSESENRKNLAVRKEIESLQTINARNKRLNQQTDLQGAMIDKAEVDNMSEAERLQYCKRDGQTLPMSADIIEQYIKEGKLMTLDDGTICTANKLVKIRSLPVDLEKKGNSPVKPKKRTAKEKEDEAKRNREGKKDIFKYYDLDNNEIPKPDNLEEMQDKIIMKKVDSNGNVLQTFTPIDEKPKAAPRVREQKKNTIHWKNYRKQLQS